MNRERRNQIELLMFNIRSFLKNFEDLYHFSSRAGHLRKKKQYILDYAERIKKIEDEEDDAFSRLPDNFLASPSYQNNNMESAASDLHSAYKTMLEIAQTVDILEKKHDISDSGLDEIKEKLNDAFESLDCAMI